LQNDWKNLLSEIVTALFKETSESLRFIQQTKNERTELELPTTETDVRKEPFNLNLSEIKGIGEKTAKGIIAPI